MATRTFNYRSGQYMSVRNDSSLQFLNAFRNTCCTIASVATSKEEEASSNTSTLRSRSKARANASNCRSPRLMHTQPELRMQNEANVREIASVSSDGRIELFR